MLAETVEKFKKLYSEKQEVIEYMLKFGNDFEKAEATIIKQVAIGI
ncbi:MAG: hypothetical protein NHB15_14895 [Methanosarcina barkeri]|nr:hypothetical protein [Methanosarcina sp. ERenArc_MAG2]